MIKGIIFLFFYCLLLTLCIFIPYSLHLVNGVSNVIDPLFYAWNLSYNADNMFSGLSSALNTNIFYPLNNTLAYSDTLWVQSLLTNPIIWLTNNPILAENLAVMFTFPLSAVSMYLLAWHFTKNTRASFLSGIFFTFSYPRLSQIGHLPIISSQWLPLYLLFLIKFLNDGKRINFLFLCIFYLFAIGSSIYFGVFLIPITLLILLIDMLNRIRHHTINEYSKLTISAFPIVIPFSILLTLIVFPYVRLKVEYPTIKRAIDDVTFLRASPVDFISILPTSLFSRFLPNNTNEHALFPTFTLILLAFFGIIRSAKRYRYAVVVFITIAASSFILSLGNEQSFSIGSFSIGPLKLPYYYFYMWFPIFQIVRVPARFSIFIILSLSMLASFRLDALLKKPRSWVLTIIILVIFLMEVWQKNTPFVSIPEKNAIPKVYSWLRAQPEPVVIAELPISLFYHGTMMENQLYTSYASLNESGIYAIETYRIYFSTLHKKRMINGYSGFLPDRYNRTSEILESFPEEHTIQTLLDIGVTHVIVHIWQYDKRKIPVIMESINRSLRLKLLYSDPNDLVYSLIKN